MYIVMFSINPLFPTAITGGAPKHLKSVAVYLGELGHEVVILCSQVSDSRETFQWRENVTVHPILRFKQPFPQPYAIPAYDMALMIQDMGEFLAKADRFYMHDGEFLFPFAYQDVPTVVSLRDNIYPETLLGGFQFQSDKLILISEYSRRYFMDTVGRFFPELAERIEVVHNGVDWDVFQPTAPKEILDVVPIDPQRSIVLHPHRPEESKGIRHTLSLVDQLVHRHGLTDVLALAPKWMESQLTPELRDFYHEIEQFIVERGLTDNFYFHGWISQDLMPQYYSLGAVTVSLGSFPESFGNAVYESLGCGTPSVVARVTTHRELLPDELIDKVDYGDIDRASEIVADIIRSGRRTSDETLAYLKTHYQVADQRQRYADLILNAQVVPPMRYAHPSIDANNTRYQLAYWCYRSSSKGVYHDFYGNYRDLSALDALLDACPEGSTMDDAVRHGVEALTIEELYRLGYFVPMP